MQNFNQYCNKPKQEELLTENKEGKNLHLAHLEDIILHQGIVGARESLLFLISLRDMLAGHTKTKVNVSTKFDGCVHGDTVILTNKGDVTIRDIVEQIGHLGQWPELKIMGRNLDGKITYDVLGELESAISKQGNKSWVDVTLENGEYIRMTEDHEVHTSNRGWVKAKDLTQEDDITKL